MNEVDLRSYPLPKHRSVFSALRNLGVSIGYDGWCLVVGTAHGAAGRRCEGTKDGDVVVDIVADPRMLERVTATLRSHGFEIADAVGGSGEWAGGNTARCTLVFGLAQIDVLCPDGTPDEMLDSVDGMRYRDSRRYSSAGTQRGGRHFLRRRNRQRRTPLSDTSSVPIARGAAVTDEWAGGHPRHIQDVAFLLSLIEDPVDFSVALTDAGRATLTAVAARIPDMPTMWDTVSKINPGWPGDDDRTVGLCGPDSNARACAFTVLALPSRISGR